MRPGPQPHGEVGKQLRLSSHCILLLFRHFVAVLSFYPLVLLFTHGMVILFSHCIAVLFMQIIQELHFWEGKVQPTKRQHLVTQTGIVYWHIMIHKLNGD